jgi:transposase-like protein
MADRSEDELGGRYTGNVREHSPAAVMFDYRQCRHEYLVGHGVGRRGEQRMRCLFCGQSFTEDQRQDGHLARIRVLAPFFKAGASMKRASLATGYNYASVTRYYRLFAAFGAGRGPHP